MKTTVFTASTGFIGFLQTNLEADFEHQQILCSPRPDPTALYLLHISDRQDESFDWLAKYAGKESVQTIVCADLPTVEEMLRVVRLGARAYCNSYMAAEHYRQMLRLVRQGESWFPPPLLKQTFELAQQAIKPEIQSAQLQVLTQREQEIALSVCAGNSNRRIAELLAISEATVKTHLSSVFRKLEVEDRVGLVLLLKNT